VRLPPPAGPGDRIGVAALSGPVDPERLERGLAALRGLGFEPVLADNARSRDGLFAGGDDLRLAAFHRLAARRDLTAILFTRGGHGLLRVLPGIDWELLRRHPRAYLGYSDLTPFLLAVVQRLGLAAFHGPLVGGELARGLDGAERASLLGALAGRYPVEMPFASWLRPGRVAGPLLGGCLSLLAATLGTPYFPDLGGAIVFWEEVNEPPYRLDRMLTHLGLSGRLDAIGGMVVGHVTPPSGSGNDSAGGTASSPGSPGAPVFPEERPDERAVPSWAALIADSLSRFPWPLACGLDVGHRSPNLTLPLGLHARLDPGSPAGSPGGTLTLGC
jgi:muramoyltetrapeptide carboxypeptidase